MDRSMMDMRQWMVLQRQEELRCEAAEARLARAVSPARRPWRAILQVLRDRRGAAPADPAVPLLDARLCRDDRPRRRSAA